MGNTIDFVRAAVLALRDGGIVVDLFGGWAEELLGLRPPGPHRDLDLVYRAADFSAIDILVDGRPDLFRPIDQKSFFHKRAFVFQDVLCEILLVENAELDPVTNFWGDTPFHWRLPFLHPSVLPDRMPMTVVHEHNLRTYRSGFRLTENHRWQDPASVVSRGTHG